MNNRWTALEVLRHARHDWLNRIQLIKGYISLNKVDRVKEIIDEIIVDAHQESKLSNMKIPEFASLLLVYNWESHPVQVEYEILDGEMEKTYSVDDRFLTNWTMSFLRVLNSSVEDFGENHLIITLERHTKGYRFFFDFRGRIIQQEKLINYLQKHSTNVKNVHEFTEQELSLELFFPYIELV